MMKKVFSLILALALSLACVSALAEGAFPVEIKHAYGTTVIEAEPERVATLFDSNPDPVLALGVVPVGVSSIGYGVVDENGLPAWTNAAFTALDAEANVYDDTDGIAWEQVSDSEPDLILLPNSGITQEDYDHLSEIAPTVPYKEIAYATTWREEVEVTAKALGKEEEGAQLIADTEALIAEKLAEHPELEGKTAAFCWIDVSDLSVVYVYMPLDPRAAFLEDLGLSMENLTGEALRAMNAQVCGLEDGIASLNIDGSTITATSVEGETVFSHEYSYADTVENAIEGAPMYVFKTADADAGKYTYLCLTQPAIASDEGGVIDNFNLRYAEADYEALFAEDYAGSTCVLVSGDTTVEDMEYTIRLIYTGSAE